MAREPLTGCRCRVEVLNEFDRIGGESANYSVDETSLDS